VRKKECKEGMFLIRE